MRRHWQDASLGHAPYAAEMARRHRSGHFGSRSAVCAKEGTKMAENRLGGVYAGQGHDLAECKSDYMPQIRCLAMANVRLQKLEIDCGARYVGCNHAATLTLNYTDVI